MATIRRKENNMRAFLAIGCTDATTQTQGSFLYVEKSDRNQCVAITPIFSHCQLLFNWLRKTGWKEVNEHPKPNPVGTYEKGEMTDAQLKLYQKITKLNLTTDLNRYTDYVRLSVIDGIEYYAPNDEELSSIVALSHEHKLAAYTGFYDMDDIKLPDSDYAMVVHKGELKCKYEVEDEVSPQ